MDEVDRKMELVLGWGQVGLPRPANAVNPYHIRVSQKAKAGNKQNAKQI